MKVVIFNGGLKLTTFVEALVNSLASIHEVYVMGFSDYILPAKRGAVKYISLGSSNNVLRLITTTFYWLLIGLLNCPGIVLQFLLTCEKKHIKILMQEFNTLISLHTIAPQIIHIQWASHLQLFNRLNEKKLLPDFKIVVSLRGRLINVAPVCNAKLANFYQTWFSKVDGFHAVSRAIAREAERYGAAPEKINVIYSGQDIKVLKKYRKKCWAAQHPFTVLSVGRFHWKKGYHYALDAIKLLVDRGFQFKYVIIAAGETPQEILYQISELQLGEFISLLPGLPQKEVFAYMQQADCFLLPSVEEGIANVVLEAMTIGLPVVTSNCGGMEEAVTNGENGLVFQNRSIKSLAEKLLEMRECSPDERKRMAFKAIQTVEKCFSRELMTNSMLTLYSSLS